MAGTYDTETLIETADGIFGPQGWDAAQGKFVPDLRSETLGAAVYEVEREAFDDEVVAVSSGQAILASAKFQPGSGEPAEYAEITIEGGDMRYRVSGSNASSTVGHLLQAGDVLRIDGTADMVKFRATRVAADGSLQVTYYRRVA